MTNKRVVDWVTGIVIALLLLIAFLLNSCAHYELRENPRVTLAKRVRADSLLYFLFPADTSLYHLFLYEDTSSYHFLVPDDTLSLYKDTSSYHFSVDTVLWYTDTSSYHLKLTRPVFEGNFFLYELKSDSTEKP